MVDALDDSCGRTTATVAVIGQRGQVVAPPRTLAYEQPEAAVLSHLDPSTGVGLACYAPRATGDA